MISSARLGDKHVCPLPGHGTTLIASASGDVAINFMGAARVGDTCGCGAVITTGFPSIQVNGRPMAHLGSLTSHGGTIIMGSGDVGGGFFMGEAGGATIINFMALGAFRPDGSVDDEKMATLLADPNLNEKAGLSESALSDGAGLEQIASDSLRKFGEKFTEILTQQTPEKPLPGPHRSGGVEGLRAWDDIPDRISIGIGVQLYKEQPGGGITAKMVMDKVLAVSPTEWGEGVRAHKCHTS